MTDETVITETSVEAMADTGGTSGAIRSAVVYALGSAVPRAIGLLTLPIYTHVLGPQEYGTFALLVAISTAVAIVFGLGLDVAIFRLYFQLATDPVGQRRFVGTVWTVLMVVPISAAFVIGLVSWPFVSGARFTPLELLLALVGAAMAVASSTAPLAVLRAEQRLRAFVLLTTVSTVASVGLALLFVVGFRWGVAGWLGAAIIASALTLAVSIRVVPFEPPRPFDRPLLRNALGFGAPLVPHAFAHWALQVADRVVIAGIVTQAALGVYSLASNLALPVLMLVQAVNYAFMPTYARARIGEESQRQLADMVVLQAVLVALICSACALLAPPFIELATPASYHAATELVPWIVLGYGFLGLYFIPMNGISLGGGRTRFAAVTSISAAALNIGSLYAFVPAGGIHAAAIAAAVAYAVLLIAVFLYARRPENPVVYRWRALGAALAVVTADYVMARLLTHDAGGISVLVERTLLLLLALPALLAADPRRRSSVRRSLAKSRRHPDPL